jgi:ferredoxin-NADP reductase
MRKYKLSEIKELAADVKAFRFTPIEGAIPEYKPGHFAFLHLLDEKGETIVKRPYSVASAPHMPFMELCIKLIGGELTGRLEKLEVGAIVGIEDPGGHLTYEEQDKAGFIAGGSGMAPIISMLRHIAHRKLKGEFVLFYSSRTKDNILYRDELEQLQEENPDIKVIITLTREEWEGPKGRLCHSVIERFLPDAKDYYWWICGPMGMIKGMKGCLSELGVDPKNIKMEGWG